MYSHYFESQYFYNRQIVVQYAFKKETRGERHGSAAERLLAGSNPDRARIAAMMSTMVPPMAAAPMAAAPMAAVPPAQPGMMPMIQPGVMNAPMQPGVIGTPMQPGVMGAPMQPGMMGAPMQPGMMSTPMQPGMVGTPMQPGVMGAPMMGGMAPIQ